MKKRTRLSTPCRPPPHPLTRWINIARDPTTVAEQRAKSAFKQRYHCERANRRNSNFRAADRSRRSNRDRRHRPSVDFIPTAALNTISKRALEDDKAARRLPACDYLATPPPPPRQRDRSFTSAKASPPLRRGGNGRRRTDRRRNTRGLKSRERESLRRRRRANHARATVNKLFRAPGRGGGEGGAVLFQPFDMQIHARYFTDPIAPILSFRSARERIFPR